MSPLRAPMVFVDVSAVPAAGGQRPMPETSPPEPPDRLPVPIAVLLPAAPARHRPPPADTGDPAGLTPATARYLVAIYTHPGDLVVDLTGAGRLGDAAASMDRRAIVLAPATGPDSET